MAVNVPLVHISDLAEATTASDTGDYLVIGAADAKKIKWGTIFNLIKTKLGLSAVATTGSYNDLSNKPSIPSSLASFGVTASAANLNQTAGATGNLQTQINSLNTKIGSKQIIGTASMQFQTKSLVPVGGAEKVTATHQSFAGATEYIYVPRGSGGWLSFAIEGISDTAVTVNFVNNGSAAHSGYVYMCVIALR